jgi:nitrite reductase/ring-hydroxylating ferredoxin subunit
MPARYKAASVNDIAPGSMKVATVAGTEIVIARTGDAFHALANACVHRGGPLGEGELNGCIATCPWHGWQFDVATGASPTAPQAKQPTYRAWAEGNDVYVEI